MSSSALQIIQSTVFRKIVVALTGLALIGFLFVHMVGNLQVFAGPGATIETTKINEYAAFLKKEAVVLWGARLFLLAMIAIHILTTISLTQHNREARPQGYEVRKTYSSAASRMMIFGGLAIMFYVIYHILHFTTGTVHTGLYQPHDVYGNLIRSFQDPLIVFVYVAAQIALFGHLYHGAVSLFRTLGVSNPTHVRYVKGFGIALSVIICGGFISIPVGIWLGAVGLPS